MKYKFVKFDGQTHEVFLRLTPEYNYHSAFAKTYKSLGYRVKSAFPGKCPFTEKGEKIYKRSVFGVLDLRSKLYKILDIPLKTAFNIIELKSETFKIRRDYYEYGFIVSATKLPISNIILDEQEIEELKAEIYNHVKTPSYNEVVDKLKSLEAHNYYNTDNQSYIDYVINEIITKQVKAGGVDTDGSREEAKRWLGFVANSISEGLMSTTNIGSFKLTKNDNNIR